MNLTGLIGSLPTTTVLLTRRGTGTYTKGVFSGGSTTTEQIRAIYWPAGPKEIDRLPDGIRTREAIGIASGKALLPADHATNQQADIITIGGASYEVQALDNYVSQAGICKAIATRVNA